MKLFFKIVAVLFILLAASIAAGMAIIYNMDFGRYKEDIIRTVERETGRKLSIEGDLDVHVSLTPSITVDGVTFANAPWGSRPDMLSVEHLEAQMSLLPLLTGTVDISKVVLKGARILIEKDKNGKGNYEIRLKDPASASGGSGGVSVPIQGSGGEGKSAGSGKAGDFTIPVIRQLDVRDAEIDYRDASTGTSQTVRIERISIAGDGPDKPMQVEVSVDLNGTPLALGGSVGSAQAMLDPAQNWTVDLVGTIASSDLTLRGSILDPTAAKGVSLSVGLSGGEVAGLAALGGVKLPKLGPFDIKAQVTGDAATGLSLKDLKAFAGTRETAKLSATGAIKDVAAMNGLGLSVKLESADMANLSRLSTAAGGPGIPGKGPLTFSADISGSPAASISLRNISATLGDSDLKGKADIRLDAKRPKVTADLSSDLFDTAVLAGGDASGQSDEVTGGSAAPAPAKSAASGGGKQDGNGFVIPDTPISLEGLNSIDADLSYQAARMVLDGLPVDGLSAVISLQGGLLKIAPFKGAVGEGAMSGSLDLDSSKATPQLALTFRLDKVNIGAVLASRGYENMTEGPVDADIDLRGSGQSLHAMASSLNGKARAILVDGILHGKALDASLGRDASELTKLLLGAKGGDISLDCAVADLKVAEGITEPDVLFLNTSASVVTGQGTVNLGTEKLDLLITPQTALKGLGATIPVRVKGTLAKPVYLPDAARALALLGGARSTGKVEVPAGLSALKKQQGWSDDHPCLRYWAKAAKPANGTKDTAPSQDGSKQIVPNKALEDAINKGLNKLFGN